MKITTTLRRWTGAIALFTLLTPYTSALEIGAKAPAFTTQTIEGNTVDMAQWLGKKPVYLKFWATWCSYCKRELPHAQAIYDQYHQQIEILTINVGLNDSVSNIRELYQTRNIHLPTVFDAQGDLVTAYGVLGTPNHVLIDAEGKLVYRSFLATDELNKRIAAMAEDANEGEPL